MNKETIYSDVGPDHDITPNTLYNCPFCGAGTFTYTTTRTWLGMRWSDPFSHILKHWCVKGEGDLNCFLEFRCKTREQLISKWNNCQ